jgi:hypothetical protein
MSRVRDLASILTASSSIATDTEVSAVSAQIPSQVAGKNLILNGGFDIWQRGTSVPFGAVSGRGADRWVIVRAGWSGGATMSRQASGLTGIQYCARVQRDSGNTGTGYIAITQTLEVVNCIPYQGRVVTFSFYARAGANYSNNGTNSLTYGLYTGTGAEQNLTDFGFTGQVASIFGGAALTTSWQRFSYTATLGSSITQIGAAFSCDVPVGTAGANDYFEITGVQVEATSAATPFNRLGGSIQGELTACQRYFQTSFPFGTAPANNVAPGMIFVQIPSNGMSNAVMFPVPMRATPSFATYNPYDNNSSWRIAFSATNVTPTVNHMGNLGIYTGTTSGHDSTVARAVHGNWAASAEL